MSRGLARFRGAPCLRKRSFATEAEALARLAHYARLKDRMAAKRAYLCPWCDKWHLTKDVG